MIILPIKMQHAHGMKVISHISGFLIPLFFFVALVETQ
jgi:hypothetical protein